MATEEQNKPASASNAGNGDMAHLIGNVGVLIDSAVESVQGVISTVSTATEQIIEGVTTTIKSEPVQGMLNTVNTAAGQVIEGVTATLKSDQVQQSFQELGKFWEGLISNLNDKVKADQVKDLFENVSNGMSQLVGKVFSSAIPTVMIPSGEDKKKVIQEIHFNSPKDAPSPLKADAPAPAAPKQPQAAVPAPAAGNKPESK